MIDHLLRLCVVIRKDWLMLVRDRAGLAVLFIMPLALVFVVSLVHDAAWQVTQTSSISLLLVNEDDGDLSNSIEGQLLALESFEVSTDIDGSSVSAKDARLAVVRGRFKVCVIIPAGTSASFDARAEEIMSMALAGDMNLDLGPIQNGSGSNIAVILDPTVPKAFTENVLNALSRCLVMTETRLLLERISQRARAARPRRRWWQFGRKVKPVEAPSVSVTGVDEMKYGGLFVGVSREFGGEVGETIIPTSTQHNVPAWTVFAMFFIVVPLSGHLISERKSGTLQRLLVSPIGYGTFLTGKVVVYLLVCLCQFGLMILMGLYVLPLFGLPELAIGSNHAALLLLAVSTALAAIGFGLVIGTVMGSQQQASTFGAVAVIIGATTGGIMVPVFVLPVFLQQLSLLSPLAWGLNGAMDVFLRNAGMLDVLPDVARLLGFFVVTMLVALVYRVATMK